MAENPAARFVFTDENQEITGKPLAGLKKTFPEKTQTVQSVTVAEGNLVVTKADGTAQNVALPVGGGSGVHIVDNGDGTASILTGNE